MGKSSAHYASKQTGKTSKGIRKAALAKAELPLHPHEKPIKVATAVRSASRKGRKPRKKPVVDDAMNARIDQVILQAEEFGAAAKVHSAHVQHYIDFFEA